MYKYQGFRRIRAIAHHLIRQPFGLPPSPQGEGFGCIQLFDKFLFDLLRTEFIFSLNVQF